MDAVPLLPGLTVSRETNAQLHAFVELVEKWTPAINLVSKADKDRLWARHILDSAQLVLLGSDLSGHWADLGSGGGFPGIVVAILLAELAPAGQVSLVESDQRKAAFLRTAARELGLRINVIDQRADTTNPLQADTLSARALGNLSGLLPFALRHMNPAGTAIFPKGRNASREVDAARTLWAFNLRNIPSLTDPTATILALHGIRRA